jgi:hypothetical protein
MCDECDLNMLKVNEVAEVAHQVNKAYCESLGDFSQDEWIDSPAWQQESARSGVMLHMRGDSGPEASHESWMQDKLDSGWVFGEIKDADKKTHPCMVDFQDLPIEQQAKDYIFRAVVHAMNGKQ